jgi:hypothetical protein
MTTFAYTLDLDDSEFIVLSAALDLLLEKCQKEMADGPKAPYLIWEITAKKLLARLAENTHLTSYTTNIDGQPAIVINVPAGPDKPRKKSVSQPKKKQRRK